MAYKKYIVQFTKKYDIRVTAESESEATLRAEAELWDAECTGTAHFFESGDTEKTVFDVTGTDDANF